MPLSQDFDTYPSTMGMETGNLGLDVPAYDAAADVSPLTGTPATEAAPVAGVDYVTDAQGYTYYLDGQGNILGAEDAAGNVVPVPGADELTAQTMARVDQSAPVATQVQQAASAGGFNINDLTKLVGALGSVYAGVQQASIQKAAMQRGITPQRPGAAQTRTVRDPTTGKMLTQRFNPATGQWQTVGGAGDIFGLPAWAVLGGGALALFLLAKPGRR